MELTIEERQAVEHGDVLKYVIPGSHVECVVVREDMLDPLRARLDYSACDADDLASLTAEVLPDEDWTTPEGRSTQ
jgi:hypothetical protein